MKHAASRNGVVTINITLTLTIRGPRGLIAGIDVAREQVELDDERARPGRRDA